LLSFHVVKAPLYALFSRGIGLLLQFMMNIVLARFIGAAGMGVYSLYTSWMMVLSSAVGMGMPNHSLRTVSVLEANNERRSIRVFSIKVISLVFFLGLITAGLISLSGDFLTATLLGEIDFDHILIFSAVAAIFFIIIRVLSESLKGLRKINAALIMETSFIPSIILLLLAAYYLFNLDLSVETFFYIHISSLFVLTIVMLFFLILVTRIKNKNKNVSDSPAVFSRSLFPFWGGALLNMWFINMPIILLPQFASVDEIGVFGVAYRLIALASTVLITLASIFGPQFARDYANGDIDALKRGLLHSQLYSLLIYAPILFIFIFFAEPLLGIFGEEFINGKELLWVMAIGQLLNSATGLVGYLMNMIHQEKQEFYIQLWVTLFVLLLIILLGTYKGVMGVAIAYAIGIAVKNIVSWYFSLHHLNRMKSEVLQAV